MLGAPRSSSDSRDLEQPHPGLVAAKGDDGAQKGAGTSPPTPRHPGPRGPAFQTELRRKRLDTRQRHRRSRSRRIPVPFRQQPAPRPRGRSRRLLPGPTLYVAAVGIRRGHLNHPASFSALGERHDVAKPHADRCVRRVRQGEPQSFGRKREGPRTAQAQALPAARS